MSKRQYVFNGKIRWDTDLSEFPGGISLDTISSLSGGAIVIGAQGASYGELQWQGNSTAGNCGAAGTFIEINSGGGATLGDTSHFTATTGGRLTYIGTRTRIFSCRINITAFTGVSGTQLTLGVGKNGVAQGDTFMQVVSPPSAPSNASTASISTGCYISLATNDYISGFFTINTGANFNLTVVNCKIVIESIDND